jgi:hypothetical protein
VNNFLQEVFSETGKVRKLDFGWGRAVLLSSEVKLSLLNFRRKLEFLHIFLIVSPLCEGGGGGAQLISFVFWGCGVGFQKNTFSQQKCGHMSKVVLQVLNSQRSNYLIPSRVSSTTRTEVCLAEQKVRSKYKVECKDQMQGPDVSSKWKAVVIWIQILIQEIHAWGPSMRACCAVSIRGFKK